MDLMIEQVLTEVRTSLNQISGESLAQAVTWVENAPRVFVTGVGRSGLCMRALGMRLMHLGKTVYVVGETITPNITAGDLLMIGSGSGQTAGLRVIAEQARDQGANVLLFTTDAASSLAALADFQVIISAPTKKTATNAFDRNSVQPMGTLFEQSLLILCDCLILGLMQKPGVDVIQMDKRHANLE
ncbi:MAG: 6-phospho-3-hexuloisomerase [Chloroflexi bacterium]|nr:MAG: 6-phospho-3-hexuloisomerase [Chloroflexota bacterium]